MAKSSNAEHNEFLMLAYFGLVVRGYDNERSISDPILRKVWRYGKRLAKQNKVTLSKGSK